jgi:hypothetical protein
MRRFESQALGPASENVSSFEFRVSSYADSASGKGSLGVEFRVSRMGGTRFQTRFCEVGE